MAPFLFLCPMCSVQVSIYRHPSEDRDLRRPGLSDSYFSKVYFGLVQWFMVSSFLFRWSIDCQNLAVNARNRAKTTQIESGVLETPVILMPEKTAWSVHLRKGDETTEQEAELSPNILIFTVDIDRVAFFRTQVGEEDTKKKKLKSLRRISCGRPDPSARMREKLCAEKACADFLGPTNVSCPDPKCIFKVFECGGVWGGQPDLKRRSLRLALALIKLIIKTSGTI